MQFDLMDFHSSHNDQLPYIFNLAVSVWMDCSTSFSFNLLILANRDVWWHTVLWILSLLVV